MHYNLQFKFTFSVWVVNNFCHKGIFGNIILSTLIIISDSKLRWIKTQKNIMRIQFESQISQKSLFVKYTNDSARVSWFGIKTFDSMSLELMKCINLYLILFKFFLCTNKIIFFILSLYLSFICPFNYYWNIIRENQTDKYTYLNSDTLISN